jgi:hypothetical protein
MQKQRHENKKALLQKKVETPFVIIFLIIVAIHLIFQLYIHHAPYMAEYHIPSNVQQYLIS